MDSKDGEGRPYLGPALSVQTDAGKFFAISCKPVGRGVVSYPCKAREMNRAMEQGVRTVRYDPDLGLEALSLQRDHPDLPRSFSRVLYLGLSRAGAPAHDLPGHRLPVGGGRSAPLCAGGRPFLPSCRRAQSGLRRPQCTGRDNGRVCPGDYGGGVLTPVPGTSDAPERTDRAAAVPPPHGDGGERGVLQGGDISSPALPDPGVLRGGRIRSRRRGRKPG